MRKKLFITGCVFIVLAVIGAIGYGVYYKTKYERLIATIETTVGAEFIQQVESVTEELKQTRTALARSEQSVAELERIGKQWARGHERIERSIDAIGNRIINAQSGNERTEEALRGIWELSFIFEEEFGRGAEQH
ncbi:MAG: hypothetical protein LBH20_09375 [Treponema sp.]|nr:hypothetical protein [Treponema sp.]